MVGTTGPVQGRRPTAEDNLWLDAGRDLAKGSIDAVEGTAKNLLTAVGVLEGLYFHAVSFEKVYDRIGNIGQSLALPTWAVAVLFGLPAVLWLLSAASAMMALTVERYELHLDEPARLEQEIQQIAKDKFGWVKWGSGLLVAGLAILCVNLFVYLAT